MSDGYSFPGHVPFIKAALDKIEGHTIHSGIVGAIPELTRLAGLLSQAQNIPPDQWADFWGNVNKSYHALEAAYAAGKAMMHEIHGVFGPKPEPEAAPAKGAAIAKSS